MLVLGLRIHRVFACFGEVLADLTPGLGLGLSPSRIVKPLLCAVCGNEGGFVGDARRSWMGGKMRNGGRSRVGRSDGKN